MTDSLTSPVVSASDRNLPLQVGVAAFGRLLINTARRFPYTFAPALSRGLGVPLSDITSLIAVNQVSGILGPFLGPLSDRWGYRVMMLTGLSVFAVGMIASGAIPLYIMLLLAMLLAGIGKSMFDPALQSYVGDRVPYQRRGMAMGLIELSWSGAALIGIPLTGLLIAWFGWRAPFFVLGGLLLFVIAVLGVVLPRGGRATIAPGQRLQISQAWRLVFKSRAALGVLAYSFFSNMANDNLFVIHGEWLEESFALSVVALGTAAIVIGVAELGGELLTATVSDRLGLKQAVLVGALLTTVNYALLPFIGQTLPLALAGLFVLFLIFEFTVVTLLSLITELLPQARATLFSALLAITGLGRAAGALAGGEVWSWGQLPAIGLISALFSLIAFTFLFWGLWRWQVDKRLHN
jgi:predicted MFS family arabinose efflux permease